MASATISYEGEDPLWGPVEVATRLGISVQQLRRLYRKNKAPKPRMIGRWPRWKRSTIERWLEQGGG